MLPSVFPRLATDSAGRVFPGVWKSLFLKFPSRDGLPFPGPSSSGVWRVGRCDLSPFPSLLLSFLGGPLAPLVRQMVTVQHPQKS